MEFYRSLIDPKYKYIVVNDGSYKCYDHNLKFKLERDFGMSRLLAKGYTLVTDDDELAKIMLICI